MFEHFTAEFKTRFDAIIEKAKDALSKDNVEVDVIYSDLLKEDQGFDIEFQLYETEDRLVISIDPISPDEGATLVSANLIWTTREDMSKYMWIATIVTLTAIGIDKLIKDPSLRITDGYIGVEDTKVPVKIIGMETEEDKKRIVAEITAYIDRQLKPDAT